MVLMHDYAENNLMNETQSQCREWEGVCVCVCVCVFHKTQQEAILKTKIQQVNDMFPLNHAVCSDHDKLM